MTLTEKDLFAAYRGADGRYYADCACGGTIVATTNDQDAVEIAINVHHREARHVAWRQKQEQAAVDALKRKARHRCPCCGEVFPE